MIHVTLPGYPRIGRDRELKKATERYWKDSSTEGDLIAVGRNLRERHWRRQTEQGVDLPPAGDFSYYDTMLDAAVLFGCVPERYLTLGVPESFPVYFAMARGTQNLPALEMTKWFDTNYHYLVPEVDGHFALHPERILAHVREARQLDLNPKPVVPGPYTFLRLAHLAPGLSLDVALKKIAPLYRDLVALLAAERVEWIALDEPALVLEESPPQEEMLHCYNLIAKGSGSARILLQTYFQDLGRNRAFTFRLPVDGIGLDLVRGPEQWDLLTRVGIPDGLVCVAGIVNGRNVWTSNLSELLKKCETAREVLGDRLMLGASSSLQHLPYSVSLESGLDPEIRAWVRFAEERCDELAILKRGLTNGRASIAAELAENARLIASRAGSPRIVNRSVRERISALPEDAFDRTPYAERRKIQAAEIPLPMLPTTTIGSFPQTPEVRAARNRFRTGRISREEYQSFIDEKIRGLIQLQEEIGLDVIVHGEFERTDMVEYFAEQLDGMQVTMNGWVQSYGTRYVRPPLIYGDVMRPHPMTVRESRYAQELTKKPVKGMLTGPVTILNWSFARSDMTREDVALQIALALQDETKDLEAAGIRIIQIDEPAFREGLPLRSGDRADYLRWAVRAFQLSSSGVRPGTQIHTHMCYSDFNEIITSIAAMDADVISIENSRSSGELLKAFDDYKYPRGIGPGVYDVHSERIVAADEMAALLLRAGRLLPHDILWVNPDCGLKTRRDEEAIPTLRNMVEAARGVRAEWVSQRNT
jgi:5-methyltetrahydropteroyltriglutamate--homocysteine methyltransferase